MRARRTTRPVVALGWVLTLLLAGGCGLSGGSEDPEDQPLRMIIPNSPGGGYDLTGRAAAKALEDNELTGRVEILNIVGNSGVVAMQRLLNERGADDLVMVMGLGVVGAVRAQDSDATLWRMTPIARLVEEQEGILVPADSPFRTVDDLIGAWQADPGAVTIGGGSGKGGPDHLFPMQLAAEVGVRPTTVHYREYDGGGPLTSALLSGRIDVGISGLGEFEGQVADGTLRVLAVSGAERMDGVDAPTLSEAGVDLVFTNWRGVLAPPGITDSQRDALVDLFTTLHETDEWQAALTANGWTDNFATGAEFTDFLLRQDARVARTLEALGLS